MSKYKFAGVNILHEQDAAIKNEYIQHGIQMGELIRRALDEYLAARGYCTIKDGKAIYKVGQEQTNGDVPPQG